jgi:hypothetical protein
MKFYISKADVTEGPFDLGQLNELFLQGVLTSDYSVFKEGGANWYSLDEIDWQTGTLGKSIKDQSRSSKQKQSDATGKRPPVISDSVSRDLADSDSYKWLKRVATIYKVLGFASLGISLMGCALGILNAASTGKLEALLLPICFPIIGGIIFLCFVGTSELIEVFIDICDNTRSIKDYLRFLTKS